MLETINTGFFGTIENVTTHFVCNRFTSSDILRDHTLHIEASLVGFDDRPVENRLKCFPVRKRFLQCYSDVVLYLSIREGGGKSLFWWVRGFSSFSNFQYFLMSTQGLPFLPLR